MPAPKPIAQHKADGTFRADRHGKRAAVEVGSGGALKPPSTLHKSLRPLWRRVVATLEPSWLAGADVWLLAGLVEALHFQQDAAGKLATLGTVVKTVNGDVHRNPYFMIWRQSIETVRTLSGKLGLSPLDRARLLALVGDTDQVDAGAVFAEMMATLGKRAAAEQAEAVEADEW